MHFCFAAVIARRTVVLVLLVACARHEAAPIRAPAPPPRVVAPPQLPKPSEAATPKAPDVPPITRDLTEIAAGGVLRVLFTFNSTGYFLYRGDTLGYEYELLTMFARDAKLKLEPVVVRDSSELFDRLNRGEGDVVAAQLSMPPASPPSSVAVTDSLYATSPVVVQRSPSGGSATPTVAKDLQRQSTSDVVVRARLISTPQELAGQQVQIPRTSPYRQRLLELNEELTQDIDVVEVDESSDRLIQQLAEGEIAFTVAAENVAALKSGEYTNLIIKPAIGPPQPVVWAVRRNAPQLLGALNQWLAKKRKAGLLAVLYRKYFLDRRAYTARINSPFLTAETGTLSPYDAWFREYARIPGWDWRLVAAQAFQESRFNPRAHSWAGAVGLMQIMPRTARQLHANAADPKQSVEAACRYLWTIDEQWKEIKSDSERIKFILASYNVGTGHVQDAVRLAAKNGDDPHSWLDVSYWLIRKSKRSVYNDPVVKHGFARGTEPVAYVDQILQRWSNYKEFVKEPEAAPVL